MSGGEGGDPFAHSDGANERGSTASLPPGPTPPVGGRVVPRSQGGGDVSGAGRGSLFLPPASSVGPGGVHPPAGASTVRSDTVEPPSDANTPSGTRLSHVAGRTDGTSRVAVGESVPRLGDEPAGGSSSRAPRGSLGGLFSVVLSCRTPSLRRYGPRLPVHYRLRPVRSGALWCVPTPDEVDTLSPAAD